MERLINKYADKLIAQGICEQSAPPIIGGLDAEIVWNRQGEEIPVLTGIINGLPINSLLFAEPAEPYRSIINFLAHYSSDDQGIIRPEDTETRTFLHDIPVTGEFKVLPVIENLKRRKAVIIKNRGIISFGIVSPEQAFINYSSVCFSCFIKFFVDFYFKHLNNMPLLKQEEIILLQALDIYGKFINNINCSPWFAGPFTETETAISAMIEAGKMTVDSRMVDSFFGNISYKLDNTIFISQTGSSLDELAGYIDPCPSDNRATIAITASSEYKAHKGIYELCSGSGSGSCCRAILHGHPKFAVILSMMCDKMDCKGKGSCHLRCSENRYIADIPIIPGEVGTGPTGISIY
ncbi:MAG: class II aldolase/adducin family protein [Bacteroidia bacterium]|nr:class II aldolase/adducin family protein [Bacteroidia bacterium]